MNGKLRPLAIASCLALAVAGPAACGSDDDSKFGDGTPDPTLDAGGGTGFGNLDSGAAEGGLPASFAGCATDSRKTEKLPVDMVIGLDTSFSMDFDDKWVNVRGALKAFAVDPAYADLGVGLQFFPIRKQCSVADYQKPAVALALLPQVAGAITSQLDQQQMAGGTPMVPLLQGLSAYLRANANPGRKPVIVLATDGVPDDTCQGSGTGTLANTLDNAIAVADQARTGTPSIATFVIGVGGELSALNAIGQAGGTGNAILVDTGASAQQAFLKALDTIRKQAIPCDFDIPASAVDPKSTNVAYTPAGGGAVPFGFVGDANGCSKAPDTGWYFDDDKNPKKVILCPATCDIVKKDDLGRVDVVFGCPRIEVR